MNARFLRDEAARFRGMAEDADRVATKERFHAMAADYEARAGVGNELAEPQPAAVISEVSKLDLDGISTTLDEPNVDEPLKIRPGRKIATGMKETALVQRRPVGHPRRE